MSRLAGRLLAWLLAWLPASMSTGIGRPSRRLFTALLARRWLRIFCSSFESNHIMASRFETGNLLFLAPHAYVVARRSESVNLLLLALHTMKAPLSCTGK